MAKYYGLCILVVFLQLGLVSCENNGGCKPFPKNCATSCVSIDSMGCVICNCPKSSPAKNSSSSLSGSTSSKTQANNNGCAPFPKNCKSECATIDSMGCIVCQCPASTGISGQSTYTSSSSQGNNNGCVPFPKTCRSECAFIDSDGCIICRCPANNTSSSLSSSVSSGNSINGCPSFQKNCPSSCVILDDMGCVLCKCPATNNTGSGVQQSGNYVVPQAKPSNLNNGGCPPLDPSCPTECAAVDDSGCIKCSCSHGSSSSSSSGGGVAPSNNGGCPPLQRNCPSSCIAIDSTGCVVCPKSCSTSQSTSNNNNNSSCPPYDDYSCDNVCKMIDSRGCKVCRCPDQVTTTSVPGAGGCQSFDLGKCDPNCVMIDSSGCMSCQCRATSAPSSGSGSSGQVTAVPGAGGCPSFDLSKCDPNCVTMDDIGCMACRCPATSAPSSGSHGTTPNTQGQTTAAPGAGGCPSFDLANCDPNCVKMDSQGCLSCKCTATTPSPNGSGTTAVTTMVPGAGGCPSFDVGTCDPNCVVMDGQGCLSCTCQATTSAPSSGSGTVAPATTIPGAGGCPSFDFGTCDPSCVVMDGQGCLSCHCPASTSAPSSGSGTTAPTTAVPGAGGCPSFDFSTCDPNCVVMDGQGCLSCQCQATTAAPNSGSSTAAKTTAIPGAGGCPSFDFGTCDPNCVIMDGQGCLSCKCPATTSAPSGGLSTTAPTTAVPGAGGCPPFDFGTCDPNCVVMDGQGCLSCHCAASTSAPSGGSSTTAPTTAVPGAGGCPSFDFGTCDPNCVVMDGQGCLSCHCAATTAAPSGGMVSTAPTTAVPGAGGCPSFNFANCDPNCVVMNGQGCLTCQCAATTAAPPSGSGTTAGPTTAVPGAGGCPSFDVSTCNPGCIVTDGQGCLFCSCSAATTKVPSTNSPNSSGTTSVPGAGGCPSFDFSKCDPACVVVDGQGCMTCQCPATTQAPTTQKPTTIMTTVQPTTPIPTTTTIAQRTAPTTTAPVIVTDTSTCAPLRCVAPCNKGVFIGADHCPQCKC